jgi:hypothetical protein
MFTIYLACLIFGGILLGASIFSFGDHHTDGAGSHDTGGSGDSSNDLDSGHDISHPNDIHHIDHNINHDLVKHSLASEAAQFFSLRNFIFFSSFFGLTGTVLSLIGIGFLTTLFSSIFLGGLSYIFGYGIMKYLRNNESGEEIQLRDLIGKTGFAEIQVTKTKKGKVIISIGSQSREYVAMLSEACSQDKLKRNEKLIVIDIMNDILIVDKLDF